jgi:hypothetical protein
MQMPNTTRINGTRSGVIDRALNVGLAKAAAEGRDFTAEVKLDETQEKMVLELSNLLGLSVRSVLNAAVRFTLHYARARKVLPVKLKEYPKRLLGRVSSFELTAETLGHVRQAEIENTLPQCVVAGVKLLHGRVVKIKPDH